MFVKWFFPLGWRKLLPWTALLLGAAGVALAMTWRPAIAPIHPPMAGSFSSEQVEHGATLAKLGDCAVCHTAEGGKSLSGGRPLATPFGTLYATNITPDPETGIGRWSAPAFRRAMREGIGRNGSHLYPALPYEHFTHVTDQDVDALYAFLMARRPVRAVAPANQLIFPLGFRPLLAGWKLLFLHSGATPVDRTQSVEWNRGNYLVQGLGHCGGCHTPRNVAGGEMLGRALAGGVAEGWRAPALDASNPAARRWTVDALTTYLATGVSSTHSAAGGPMGPVVESLSQVSPADVRAIAIYVASGMGNSATTVLPLPVDRAASAGRLAPAGASLFAGACAGCHGPGAPMLAQARPNLGLATALTDDDPTSAAQAVLRGIEPPIGRRGPKMPGFAEELTDTQIADVLTYVRARYTSRSPWEKLEHHVRRARREGDQP